MCGFAAYFAPGRRFAPSLLAGADADLRHRGPDSGRQLEGDGFALVFRRLSIVDVRSIADQPMLDEQTGAILMYNGEVYNQAVLRRELEGLGHRFATTSDTEVVLKGYRQWGRGVLDRLEGMYAFVIVDPARGMALAARDPYGIKPLYLVRTAEALGVASEARPLLRLVETRTDADTVLELLVFGYAAGSNSNYAGVERVPGGTFIEIPLAGGAPKRGSFFDPLDGLDGGEKMSISDAAARVTEALERSVADHLMSDVGYTLQLSGGVDSSVVAALAAKHTAGRLKSFGLKLPDGDPRDESVWRTQVVERYGLSHEEIPVGGAEFADALPRAVRHMEGPVPHGGSVFLMLLCDRARHFSKVILTGEGADEFFGGYERYAVWPKLAQQERLARLPFARHFPDRWPFRGARRLAGRDAAVASSLYVDPRMFEELAGRRLDAPGNRAAASGRFKCLLSRIYAVDRVAYLDSLLLRQDKMSMAASVEARVPFVHVPLARVVDRIARRVHSPGGVTKPVLKRVAEGLLPRELVHRRKIGLTLDYRAWLRDPRGLGRYLDWLEEPNARLRQFLERKGLAAAVQEARAGAGGLAAGHAFRLVNVETWLRSLDAGPRPSEIFA
jgi:asparagine synthase (glutamine-hydrolysing)